MRNRGILVFLGLVVLADAGRTADPVLVDVPDWFVDEIAMLTAASGRWITDNTNYQSESEPYDAYGTEWRASFDGLSMTGRLFALKDGEEVAEFWEFRQYWHPGRNEAVVEQFGWRGVVGIGTSVYDDGKTTSDQTFWFADGSTNRTGHVSYFRDATTHVTQSFDIDADEWTPRREYTWYRDKAN